MIIDAPIRGLDKWGSGAFQAPRSSGGKKRLHKGIDIACYAGSIVLAQTSGVVSKIGYPYSPDDQKKGHFRYVQITDEGGLFVRYFYILPAVDVGQFVHVGEPIGKTQGLAGVYPGITDHFHFEVLSGHTPINPETYLSEKKNGQIPPLVR